jgi:uncharacterized membrane protein
MAKWEYDRDVKWHTMEVEGAEVETFVFVYKTEGDEYVVSAMREGDAAGGEIEYFPNLKAAKKFGEKIATDGSYVDYLTSEVE